MRTGNSDHQDWDSTPYQPDPPVIKEVASEEARVLRIAGILNLVIFWVLAAALGAGAVWAILRANHL
jgi:hypothetical protein